MKTVFFSLTFIPFRERNWKQFHTKHLAFVILVMPVVECCIINTRFPMSQCFSVLEVLTRFSFVWKGYRTLSQDVEEGICQVLAHMWLDSQILSMSGSNAASTSSSSSLDGSRSPLERKLGDFFKHQIESDTSPVYGNGYRAGKQAILKYGLMNTLEHIRLTGYFPC